MDRYYLIKMKMCYIGSSYYKMTLSTAYLKIFLNFLQTIQMSQLIRFKDLRDILFITNIVGQPLQTVFFSIDCWLSEFVSNKKELTEVKILLVILAPLMFILIVGGLSFLIYKYKRGININKVKYITNTIIIYGLINIFSINCFRILVNALFCRQIGNQLYLKIDLTQQCDDNQDLISKQLFFYLPSCLLWSFLIPSIIFYGLFKQRHHLNKISTRYMYGFLYNEYKNNYYFWDFIRMVKNIILVIIANQYQNNKIWIFSLLAIVISQLYTISLLVIRPFNTTHLNRQEIWSSFLASITFFACLMMSLQENIHSSYYNSHDDVIDNRSVNERISRLADDDHLVYYVGLFVTMLICIFSIKTIFNIFISFFERRLFFQQITAFLFNRPITFRRFNNIKKMRNLLDAIIQFSKTDSKEKYDESLKYFMTKYRNQNNLAKCKTFVSSPNSQNQIKQRGTDKQQEQCIGDLIKQRSQEAIELSHSVNIKGQQKKGNFIKIFKKQSNNNNNNNNQYKEENPKVEQNQNLQIQCNQISFNSITQIFTSPVNGNSLNAQLINYEEAYDKY